MYEALSYEALSSAAPSDLLVYVSSVYIHTYVYIQKEVYKPDMARLAAIKALLRLY